MATGLLMEATDGALGDGGRCPRRAIGERLRERLWVEGWRAPLEPPSSADDEAFAACLRAELHPGALLRAPAAAATRGGWKMGGDAGGPFVASFNIGWSVKFDTTSEEDFGVGGIDDARKGETDVARPGLGVRHSLVLHLRRCGRHTMSQFGHLHHPCPKSPTASPRLLLGMSTTGTGRPVRDRLASCEPPCSRRGAPDPGGRGRSSAADERTGARNGGAPPDFWSGILFARGAVSRTVANLTCERASPGSFGKRGLFSSAPMPRPLASSQNTTSSPPP